MTNRVLKSSLWVAAAFVVLGAASYANAGAAPAEAGCPATLQARSAQCNYLAKCCAGNTPNAPKCCEGYFKLCEVKDP